MIRGKFKLIEVAQADWMANGRRLKFACQYDNTLPEDQRFCKATPSGEFWMQVDNPAALAELQLGKFYYLDLTEVPTA